MTAPWYRAFVPLRVGDCVKVEGQPDRHVTHFFPRTNTVVSAAQLLRGRKVRAMCSTGTLREALGAEGELWGDSGAFTFSRRGKPNPSVEAVAEAYRMMDVSHGFHLDEPVAFMHRRLMQEEVERLKRERLGAGVPEPDANTTVELAGRNISGVIDKLLVKNLESAGECHRAFDRLLDDFTLVPVAQGMDPAQYAGQVASLADAGHEVVAVGGIAFRGPRLISAILEAATTAAAGAGVTLHVLGVGRMNILTPHILSGVVTSSDCSTPLDDSHRDSSGKNTYFYWLDGPRLVKLRLSEIRSGEVSLPACDCGPCCVYGSDIQLAGSKSRNHARDHHNVGIFNEHIRRTFGCNTAM